MRDVDFRTVFLSDRAGYGLATANILYHLPERPKLLQTFIWQFYDVAPGLSAAGEVSGFLDQGNRRHHPLRRSRAPADGDSRRNPPRKVPQADPLIIIGR